MLVVRFFTGCPLLIEALLRDFKAERDIRCDEIKKLNPIQSISFLKPKPKISILLLNMIGFGVMI